MVEDFLCCDFVVFAVSAIFVESFNDADTFVVSEEFRFLGKVNEEEPCYTCSDDGNCALDDVNPSPSC
jgi:hypothetical protein